MRLEPSVLDSPTLLAAVHAEGAQHRSLMPASSLEHLLLGRPEDVADWAQQRLAGRFDPVPQQIVTVRKLGHGVRPVAELFLRDQLLYRALVISWSGKLPEVDRNNDQFDLFESEPATADGVAYVVSSDITAFYSYVDYEVLSRELLAQTGDSLRVDCLVELLASVTGQKFGIPQQNDASDVLAETYIDVMQRRLIREGWSAYRYNDDFRIPVNSWPQALSAVDALEREARRLGLSLNDSKTVIRKVETYRTALKNREGVRQAIADEAELDLTRFSFDRYGIAPAVEPSDDDVQAEASAKVLELWASRETQEGETNTAVLQLIPGALANLSKASVSRDTLDHCMQMLRYEQTLTPAVATFFVRCGDTSEEDLLQSFTELLATGPYLTPWQTAWLAPALGRLADFANGTDGAARGRWVTDTYNNKQTPESIRAAVSEPAARHKLLTATELLSAYDDFSETGKPLLAAAIGATGLSAASDQAKALCAEDNLVKWQFEWGSRWA